MGANRYTGIAFSLVAAATLCVGAGEANAKPKGRGGKGRNKTETVRMVRPADGADANARGTVEVTDARKGMEAVLRLQNLDPRTVYRIVETGTGEVLGTVKTNRKGRATFDLSGGGVPRKGRAAAGGSEDGATDPVVPIEDVEGVEVICETTDECVLECDDLGSVISDEPRFLEGNAFYGDPETGTGMVSMFSYDDGEFSSESFSFVYCPPYDMNEGGFDMPHMFYADSAAGDELPLGVASIQDLAGLDFQVRSADGTTVVMEGELPAVEELTRDPYYGDDPGIWEGEWDGTWDMGGDLPPDGEWSDDWSDWGAWDPAGWMDFGDMGMTNTVASNGSGRRGGVRAKGRAGEEEPAPTSTFELLIRDPETDEFVKVGDLEYFDWGGWEDPMVIDDPEWGNWDDWSGDWTDWSDDWSGEWTWDETIDWDVIFGDCPPDETAHDGTTNARRGGRGARRGR